MSAKSTDPSDPDHSPSEHIPGENDRSFEGGLSKIYRDGLSEDFRTTLKEEESHAVFLKLNDQKEIKTIDKYESYKSQSSKQLAAVNSLGTLPKKILKKSKRPPTIIHINGLRKSECLLEKWMWHLGKCLARAPSLGFVFPLILFVIIMACLFFNRGKLDVLPSPLDAVSITFSAQYQPAAISVFFYVAAVFMFFNFNLMQAWRKFCNVSSHPVEKLRLIMSVEVCPSAILLSTLFISYGLVACISQLSILRTVGQILSCSAFYSVVFLALFSTTSLYISGHTEAAGLKWYHFGRKGDTNFTEPAITVYDRRDVRLLLSRLLDEGKSCLRSLGIRMCNLHLRFFVLLVYVIYAIFACWMCSLNKVELRETVYVPESSRYASFIRQYHSMFGKRNPELELLFYEHINYNDSSVGQTVLDMITWTQEPVRYVTSVRSWFREYEVWRIKNRAEEARNFTDNLKSRFLVQPVFAMFTDDLAFTPEGIKSRMRLTLKESDQSDQTFVVKELTHIAAKSEKAESICYIPSTRSQGNVDQKFVERFYAMKFREDLATGERITYNISEPSSQQISNDQPHYECQRKGKERLPRGEQKYHPSLSSEGTNKNEYAFTGRKTSDSGFGSSTRVSKHGIAKQPEPKFEDAPSYYSNFACKIDKVVEEPLDPVIKTPRTRASAIRFGNKLGTESKLPCLL
uniref:SSD domain-containing protein n=1 Tax=Trichuris muris TaxID=70415 RepID=A0A5S6QG57_TRIMR